jgi:hypothetical protein
MYIVDNQLYKVDLDENLEIVKFETTESHEHFKLSWIYYYYYLKIYEL